MAVHDAVSDVLLRVDGRWPVSAAAREFAAAGVPVFPCVPGAKRPLTEHGFHDASTDLARVDAWWRQHPGANIGLPTGATSGAVVVDVDVHGPVNGFEALNRARRAGLVNGWMFTVTSPSGGLHAYYPATPDTAQPSWQAARAGIDFRGDGGYIIIPPSAVVIYGASTPYALRQINTGPASTIDSGGLRDFLDPRPEPRRFNPPGQVRDRDVSRIAAWVATRGEGERNRGLFWAACRLAESGVAPSDALDVLTAAAGHAGLSEREVTTTVRSAYRAVHPPPRAAAASRADGFARPVPVASGLQGRGLS
ncbi:Primase C terminal 1 (PriCT-1) [Brevibacterium aurantiacum]|uniref:Primase C terminal 1 (PriCT-1) n=1 Tax=Brevibacterium aurantiacum TaxID=273384 RepID=A0A2H1IRK6_BREAU|nr:bifunctional DNA primase/polymerase [Brevibacterium aurantiacum]SMX77771.1 Primase C terminal 1 (PriCT-1) [Brevibacterium aurantiacum]